MDIKVVGYDKNDLNIDNISIINLEDIKSYKSDIIIINLESINDLYEELQYYDTKKYEKYDLYEYDRLNRYKYKNHKKVYILNQDALFYKYNYKNKYSNIHFIDGINEIDFEIDNNVNNISTIKNNNITKLKEYVDRKRYYFNSKDIINEFKVSNRWIKRYMFDMNNIYNNIGYSYSKRLWYKVKR